MRQGEATRWLGIGEVDDASNLKRGRSLAGRSRSRCNPTQSWAASPAIKWPELSSRDKKIIGQNLWQDQWGRALSSAAVPLQPLRQWSHLPRRARAPATERMIERQKAHFFPHHGEPNPGHTARHSHLSHQVSARPGTRRVSSVLRAATDGWLEAGEETDHHATLGSFSILWLVQ